jgi:hypothetical protein
MLPGRIPISQGECDGILWKQANFHAGGSSLQSRLEYAKQISNSQLVWENEQWVFRPENFVTFRIQYKRKNGVTLYLRGTEDEFARPPSGSKTVVTSVPGYSKIIIDDYRQAPEAFFAVERAYELYRRGRTRRKHSVIIAER